MMSMKFLIRPDHVRQIPPRFSWIDQRLVRDAHLRRLSHGAAMLYLFVVTVADRNGMSWYSTRRLCVELDMGQEELEQRRGELEEAQLIAYAEPFYQVLELPIPRSAAKSAPTQSTVQPTASREQIDATINAMRQKLR